MSTRRERAGKQSANDRKRHVRPAGLPPCPSAVYLGKRECGHQPAVLIKCHSPLCPECERDRAAKIHARWINTMSALPNLKLMTLTIKNGPDLKERINTLYQARRRLLDLRLGRNNRNNIRRAVQSLVEKRLTAGAIDQAKAERWTDQANRWLDAIERTEKRAGKSPKVRALMKGLGFLETPYESESDTWHAHLHLIVSMRYMPQIVLTVLWRMASRGAGTITDIRKIDNADNGLREVSKYVVKSWEVPEEKYQDVTDALSGVKRITRIGNIKPTEEEKVCAGCGRPSCECDNYFVGIADSSNAIIQGVAYRTSINDMGQQRLATIYITRDIKGRRVWSEAFPARGDFVHLTDSVSSEGDASPPGSAPPWPLESAPAQIHQIQEAK